MIQYNNFLIKREQSRAGSRFAECEKSRLKAKILMTLALLLTAVTGAWAKTDVLNIVVDGTSATIMYDGNASNNPIFSGSGWEQNGMSWDMDYTIMPTIKTVTIDGSCKNFSGTSLNALFTSFSGLTTINGLDNLNTVGVQNMDYMFAGCSSLTSLDLSSLNTASVTTMFYMFIGCSKLTSLDLSSWNTENLENTNSLFSGCSELTTVDLSSWNTAKVWNTYRMFYGCSKLENIYVGDGWSTAEMTSGDDMFTGCSKLPGYAPTKTTHAMAKLVPEGYLTTKPIATVTWNAATKTGTFNQPGSDVVLTPIYAKTAAFATTGTGSEVTLLKPAAAEGVIAGTTAPLIAEGTGIVATTMIGETPTAQGTVMYAVTAATATKAPELDAADTWSADVPTAEDVADDGAEVKVWYYIQGADAPDGVDATADNTFNNSEVSSLTVTVLSNKFDLTLKAANANTIDATQASKGTVSVKEGTTAADKTKDITNGKLEAIKMGSEVKLNTKAGYKFRKVEVKKKVEKTITVGEQNYTVQDGETWSQFITRQQSGWDFSYTPDGWLVRMYGTSILTLLVSSDGINWETLKLTSQDAPIDTDKQYKWN